MDGSPQKTNIGAAQQPDVMGAMQGKTERPKDFGENLAKVKQMLDSIGLTPAQAVRLGYLAQRAIQDPAMYQPALNAAIQEGLVTEEARRGPMDYKVLSQIAVIGEAAKQLGQ